MTSLCLSVSLYHCFSLSLSFSCLLCLWFTFLLLKGSVPELTVLSLLSVWKASSSGSILPSPAWAMIQKQFSSGSPEGTQSSSPGAHLGAPTDIPSEHIPYGQPRGTGPERGKVAMSQMRRRWGISLLRCGTAREMTIASGPCLLNSCYYLHCLAAWRMARLASL